MGDKTELHDDFQEDFGDTRLKEVLRGSETVREFVAQLVIDMEKIKKHLGVL